MTRTDQNEEMIRLVDDLANSLKDHLRAVERHVQFYEQTNQDLASEVDRQRAENAELRVQLEEARQLPA